MGTIQSFTDLICWQKAHRLAIEVYKNTGTFPKEEVYGLTSQCRRAASSISANIAEGFGRRTNKERAQFYVQARGSVAELQNHLLLARDIGYLSKENFKSLADMTVEVSKLINGIIKSTSKL